MAKPLACAHGFYRRSRCRECRDEGASERPGVQVHSDEHKHAGDDDQELHDERRRQYAMYGVDYTGGWQPLGDFLRRYRR